MQAKTPEQQYAELMSFAFNQIAADPVDHTQPIDAVVYWDVANVYMQAVQYVTGHTPKCERLLDRPGLCRLTSGV
jgi:hypothetical protein